MIRVQATFFVLVTGAWMLGCGGDGEPDATTTWTDLTVDETAKTLSFEARLQRDVAEAGAWHLVVGEHGSNAERAFFVTPAAPQHIHEALVHLGGKPGDNVNGDNIADADLAVQGDSVAVTVTWDGAAKDHALSEILVERDDLAGGDPVGVDIKFGGNYEGVSGTNPSDETGCIVCLFNCSAGVTSNAAANLSLNQADGGEWRYLGDKDVLPADGTIVTFTLSL